MNKTIKFLMKEYSLEIDDIRWYVSYQKTVSILSYIDTPIDITKNIWSGKLEADLYNMEEKYLEDIGSQLERGLIDEAWIREQFAEASEIKCRRP
ncbi:MAG: hypothetical protein KAQ93_03440 [Spirochaetales bacterium]|nr:hypothetical protein [Spirochaetales bacterium]